MLSLADLTKVVALVFELKILEEFAVFGG